MDDMDNPSEPFNNSDVFGQDDYRDNRTQQLLVTADIPSEMGSEMQVSIRFVEGTSRVESMTAMGTLQDNPKLVSEVLNRLMSFAEELGDSGSFSADPAADVLVWTWRNKFYPSGQNTAAEEPANE